jgi:hypothetical protein
MLIGTRNKKHTVIAAAALFLATAITTASQVAATAGPAAASTQRLCGLTDVPESSTETVIKLLKPWESVTVTPGGRIWAGVWFTGDNGPEGWTAAAPADYPLPGARQYSLIGRVSGQTWSYIGPNTVTFYNNSPYPQYLYARVNDNVAGNGSGAFNLTTCYYV